MTRYRSNKGRFTKKNDDSLGCGGMIFMIIAFGILLSFAMPLIGIPLILIGFFIFYIHRKEQSKNIHHPEDPPIIINETPDYQSELIMRQVEILTDCVRLVNESSNLQTSIQRYYDLIETLRKLSAFSEYELNNAGVSSHDNLQDKLDELINNRDDFFNGMIERAYAKMIEQATSLKTVNGKLKKANNFFVKTKEISELSSENIIYLSELEKDFDISMIPDNPDYFDIKDSEAYKREKALWGKIKNDIETGLLPRNMVKVWSSAADDNVCKCCADLEGTKKKIDKPFNINGHIVMFPPFHKNCRCATSYEEE